MKFMLYHPLNCNTPGDPIHVSNRSDFESLLQEGFTTEEPAQEAVTRALLKRKWKCDDEVLDEVLQLGEFADRKGCAEVLMEQKRNAVQQSEPSDEPWQDFNKTDEVILVFPEQEEQEEVITPATEPVVEEEVKPKLTPKVTAKRKPFQARAEE